MPFQAPQWTDFLSCPVCYNIFNETIQRPISLGCGHTVCKSCLSKLHQKKCPFDQSAISRAIDELPVNYALLQLVGAAVPEPEDINISNISENYKYYESARRCIEELAVYLKPLSTGTGQLNSLLSRPMQRKLVTLINCQLVEEEGRSRAMRAARSLGERTVTELILQHQNPAQLSTNLWAAVRARGCQFLGPAMQEEVLKLILLALEGGPALSRKVLVLFVVQRLENQYPQASKTAIGHVVQLLYRASCFKVTKRDEESSLMELKEEFRTYEALRREHDAQIVQIATEAGLRIAPEQWSSLLYGDAAHKSHMQSIIDKLQTPQSFSQSVDELVIALQRTGDPSSLSQLRPQLELLAHIDPSPDAPPPSWENLEGVMRAMKMVVQRLVEFIQIHSQKKAEPPSLHSAKYKTSLCRDLLQKGSCPRGDSCTFAHSQDEMERFRIRNKKLGIKSAMVLSPGSADLQDLADISQKIQAEPLPGEVGDADIPLRDLIIENRQERINLADVRSVDPSVIEVVSTVSLMPPLHQAPPLVAAPMFPNRLPYPPVGPPRESYLPSPLQGPPPPSWPRMTPQEQLSYIPPTDNLYYRPSMPPPPPPSYHPSYGVGMSGETIPVHYPPVPLGYPPPPGDPSAGVPIHLPYQAQRISNYDAPLHPPPPQQYVAQAPDPWQTTMPPGQYYSSSEDPYLHPTENTAYIPPPSTHYVDKLTNMAPPESLDDLHRRRNKILVQLNSVPISYPALHITVGPSPSLRPKGAHVGRESSVYATTLQSGPTGQSLAQSPLSSHSLAKSVTDSLFTAHSTSTLARTLSLDPVSKEAVKEDYMPWSSGASLALISVMTDSQNTPAATSPSQPEVDQDSETEDEFSRNLVKQISNAALSDDDENDIVEDGSPQPASSLYQQEETTRQRDMTPTTSGTSFLDDDFFIPFDPPIVSKYGPISRCAKARVRSSDPVNVMAEDDSKTLNPVTAVTPINRPYPISVQAPTKFPRESGSSQLRPDAKPFTSMMPRLVGRNIGLVARCSGATVFPEPYSLWESHSYMRPSSSATVQDHLKHELAHLERRIQLTENSQRQLSVQERLHCELHAIEHHISLQTGKTPNASLETQGAGRHHSHHLTIPTSMSLQPTNQSQVLDANIDLNAALTPEEERELKNLEDLHLALEAQKHESDTLKNQKEQVTKDRRYAELLVLEEARKKGISSTNSDVTLAGGGTDSTSNSNS